MTEGIRSQMLTVTTADYHTAGEPFRIVTGGDVPQLPGSTVLERRRWAAAHADHVRRLLVNEPRGHADMYGCFVVPPDDAGADLGAVFFHNQGYSTACGHGTIALVRWALDEGLVKGPKVAVDVPSGRVVCTVVGDRIRFQNVPAYVFRDDADVPIAFGGAFYAIVEAPGFGPRDLPELIARGRALKAGIEAGVDVVDARNPELFGIYGVIFTDGNRNVTVFADGEVDRSPCGSGTSARLALLHAHGRIGVGEEYIHESIVGTRFVARCVETTPLGVITEIESTAHRTGRHQFVLEDGDDLGTGFLLR